jgi:integrase
MRLTDTAIKNLKPKASKYFIHGDMSNGRHGFAICVYPASQKYPSGTKSWFFIYRFEGKRCFLPLGKYPTMSLADASREFERHWQIFASGKNPATVEEDKMLELEAAPTVKKLAEEYIERHAMANKKSWLEDQRILEKEVYPAWGKKKAHDITKRHVNDLLDKVVDRGSPQTANNIFKIIRKMFNWAVEKDRLKISPCLGVKAPASTIAKDRALSAAEIKTVWNSLATPDISMTLEVRQAIKLILLTAQRPGEVSGMHTREIDGSWWTIPAERSKNKKAHRVFLSPLASEIINQTIEQVKAVRDIPEDHEYCGYIFPCPHRSKDKSIERHALSKALKRNESEDGLTTFGIALFTPHDLRRTAATFMAESGELDEVIDAVLNHSKQGIIKVYNLYRYDKEKQKALEAWEQKLINIISAAEPKVSVSLA